MAVLNLGIGGNRLLNDGMGVSALTRFDRDVVLSKNSIDETEVRVLARVDVAREISVRAPRTSVLLLLCAPCLRCPSPAVWIHQQQRDLIDYLQEENRALREQLGPRRLQFTDDQRRRLAAKARTLGRQVLRDIATIVTPDTLLAWRTLIAREYDGSPHRGPGRPRVRAQIRALIVRMATLST
jgi:hypothetical protein